MKLLVATTLYASVLLCGTTALACAAGVQIFRVHNVRVNREAADVAAMLKNHMT